MMITAKIKLDILPLARGHVEVECVCVCDRIFSGEGVPGDTEVLFLVFITLFFLD
jgi:hypothetical protein